MHTQTVSEIAKKINKLSPVGKTFVKAVVSGEGLGVSDLMEKETFIESQIVSIDRLSAELRQKREMLDDGFNNDPVYREHSLKVKEATKARASVKKQIAQQPSVALLANQVKDLRFDLKEKKETLSDILLDYKNKTGATQLELFDGSVVEIVESARLRKKI